MVQHMGQFSTHLLILIALAVQGITPDRESLVSKMAFQVLLEYQDGPDTRGGQDDSLGEVGISHIIEKPSIFDGPMCDTAIVLTDSSAWMIAFDPFRFARLRDTHLQGDRLIDFLCRLTC